MDKNNKNNTLISIALLMIITENILDKVIELNEFISIGLDLIALICSITYLIKFHKNKRQGEVESIREI